MKNVSQFRELEENALRLSVHDGKCRLLRNEELLRGSYCRCRDRFVCVTVITRSRIEHYPLRAQLSGKDL